MQVRDKITALLLAELRSGVMEWYYISCARPGRFDSGWLIQARGPTEAWCIFHRIYRCPEGYETLTYGPLDAEKVAKIPPGLLWSKLSEEEARNLGS